MLSVSQKITAVHCFEIGDIPPQVATWTKLHHPHRSGIILFRHVEAEATVNWGNKLHWSFNIRQITLVSSMVTDTSLCSSCFDALSSFCFLVSQWAFLCVLVCLDVMCLALVSLALQHCWSLQGTKGCESLIFLFNYLKITREITVLKPEYCPSRYNYFQELSLAIFRWQFVSLF